MMHRVRGYGLAATLVLASAVAVVPQARAASTPSTAAYVYIQIQGPEGSVYGFNASSTGQLSTISGSPFKPAGLVIGGTASKFFTLGQTLIHSYPIGSSGALGSQLAQEPVFDYNGSECGGGTSGQDGAVLDHTGKYIYVMLDDGFKDNASCGAYQTYLINSDGAFSFDGETQINGGTEDSGVSGFGLPSILGSESFAYSEDMVGGGPENTYVLGFRRESAGTLEYSSDISVKTPPVSGGYYAPVSPDASPSGNTVVLQLLNEWVAPPQLGVFSVNSEGNLTTTNTSSNMPTSAFDFPTTTFSPSGNLLVAYANGSGSQGGIEIYETNGAAPLVLYKRVLSGTPIDQVSWDSSNHMYAISNKEGKLYVFTVTPTTVTEDTAWSIGSPFKMVVVSTAQTSSTSATQFEAPLLSQSGPAAVDGHVTIDTSGNTTVEVSGQTANQKYTLQFCPAADENGSSKAPACFDVMTVSTNGSGDGSSTVMFPKPGDWAGDFSLKNASGTTVLATGLYNGVSNETYMSTLLPESKTNGGAVTTNKTQDPLSSGSVSYSDGTVMFTVTGASPNTGYQTDQTNGTYLFSSQTYVVGSFTTNGAGDGSTSVNQAKSGSEGGDLFDVDGGPGAGYIGGFSIP